jgi:hypothetical protein
MILPNSNSMSESITDIKIDEGFNFTCFKGQPKLYNYTCTTGYALNYSCDGNNEKYVHFECPLLHQERVCNTMNRVLPFDGVSKCKMISYTTSNVTCKCSLFSQSANDSVISRNLQQESATTSDSHSISVVSMLKSVSGKFVQTVISASDLNSNEIKKELTVLMSLVVLWVLVMISMALGHHWDSKASGLVSIGKVNPLNNSNKVSQHRHNRKFYSVIRRNNADQLSLLEESIPKVLSTKPFIEKLHDEIKQHHKWFGVIFHYSDTFPRILRVLSLTTNIVIMIFLQSVTYNLTSPNDGSCQTFQSQSDCERPKSQFGTGQNNCYWTPNASSNNSNDGQCSFVEISNNLKVVLFVAIFSSIVGTPIALFQNALITLILAAPSNVKKVNKGKINQKRKSFLLLNKLQSFSKTSIEEIVLLSNEISEYRKSLQAHELKEFDGPF